MEALTDEMIQGAVHIGSCETSLTLDSENIEYSAKFDATWESCGIEPQMDDDWIYFEAEVEPDPPIMTGQRGIVITKSWVKVRFYAFFEPSGRLQSLLIGYGSIESNTSQCKFGC